MTENPIVPTLPGLSKSPSLGNSPPAILDPDYPAGTIRCICGFNEDDGGVTIACDRCDRWEHVRCMGLEGQPLPKEYYCFKCSPRTVDIQRARELGKGMQQGRRNELNDSQKVVAKPKKPASRAYRRKEPQNGPANGSSRTAQTAEKTVTPKLTSPKEGQPPSRKRQRIAQSHLQPPPGSTNSMPGPNTPGAATASPSPGATGFFDRNGDLESDTDFDKYRVEYSAISTCKFENATVEQYLVSTLTQPPNEDVKCERYSNADFKNISFPKTCVKALPNSSKSYSEHSQWCLVLEDACEERQLITVYNGQIGFQQDYKSEPINQYTIWNHPKRYVIFLPNLPVYVDARRQGSEARFARRSCRPNVVITPIVCDDSRVLFGLYATKDLKAGTELTLEWDWTGSPEMKRILEDDYYYTRCSAKEGRNAASWADNLVHKMGQCACVGGSDCVLNRVKKLASIKIESTPSSTNGDSVRRKRPKHTASAESRRASKETSPDNTHSGPDDEYVEHRRRSSTTTRRSRSISSLGKPGSREITPSQSSIDAEFSHREVRKTKERRIRQMEERPVVQLFTQLPKRRKRNNTVTEGGSTSTSTSTSSSNQTEKAKKYKSTSTQKDRSPTASSTSSGRELERGKTVRRRSSGSFSTSSEDQKLKSPHNPQSPATTTTTTTTTATNTIASSSPSTNTTTDQSQSQSRRRSSSSSITVVKPKPVYADKVVQTDETDDLPWWKQMQPSNLPSRPPVVPLRMRLMQSLLQDREKALAATGQQEREKEKKRKRDDDSSGGSSGGGSGGDEDLCEPVNANASPAKALKTTDGETRSRRSSLPSTVDALPTTTATATTAIGTAIDTATRSLMEELKPDIPMIEVHTANPAAAVPKPAITTSVYTTSTINTSTSTATAPALGPVTPTSTTTASSRAIPTVPSTISSSKPTNTPKTNGLHLSMPSSTSTSKSNSPPANGLPTPALSATPLLTPTTTTTALPAATDLHLHPLSGIPSLSPSTSAAAAMHTPSPTRTKKLSLGDYSKRKHRAPSMVDDKAAASATAAASITASTTTNANVTPTNAIPNHHHIASGSGSSSTANGLRNIIEVAAATVDHRLADFLATTPRIQVDPTTAALHHHHHQQLLMKGPAATAAAVMDKRSSGGGGGGGGVVGKEIGAKKIPTAPKHHQQWGDVR